MPEAQPSETPFICRRLPVVPGAPFGDHGSHGHTVDPTTATVAKRHLSSRRRTSVQHQTSRASSGSTGTAIG